MKIIIDTNIFFSALIRDGITRKMLLNFEGRFLFPGYMLEELHIHDEEIFQKAGMERKDFDELKNFLLEKLEMVPERWLKPQRKRAWEIVKDIDPDDVEFFACALVYPGSVIWSDDKALKNQDIIQIVNTEEMLKVFDRNIY